MSDKLIAVENIVNALQKEVGGCKFAMQHVEDTYQEPNAKYHDLALLQARKEAYEHAILIAKTLF